jgi:hypothetical protein
LTENYNTKHPNLAGGHPGFVKRLHVNYGAGSQFNLGKIIHVMCGIDVLKVNDMLMPDKLENAFVI